MPATNLWSIESAVALVLRPGAAELVEAVGQARFGLVPDFYVAQVLLGPRAQLHRELVAKDC